MIGFIVSQFDAISESPAAYSAYFAFWVASSLLVYGEARPSYSFAEY